MTNGLVWHGGDWVPAGMNYTKYREAGYSFAIRYIVPSIAGKMVPLAEIAEAHKVGVDMAFVYEVGGDSWRGGFNAGYADGQTAKSALLSIGAPYSVCAYHAVDTSTIGADASELERWFVGLMLGMAPYRTGVYGDYQVVELAAEYEPNMFRWQTKAWSGGLVSPAAEILQLGGSSVGGINLDIDVAYTSYFGQWYADSSKQPKTQTEDRMISWTLPPASKIPVPVPVGTASHVYLFCDTGLSGNQEQNVRVAVRSAAKGYSQIVEVKLLNAEPQAITFNEHDVHAVSFERTPNDGEQEIGFTIA